MARRKPKPLLKSNQPLDQRRVAAPSTPQAKYTRRLHKRSWSQYTLDVRQVPDHGKWITALVVVLFALIGGGVTIWYVVDGLARSAAADEQARVDLLYRSQPTLPFGQPLLPPEPEATPEAPAEGEFPPLAALDDPAWTRAVLTPVTGSFTLYDRPEGESVGSVNAAGAADIITDPAWGGWLMLRLGQMRGWVAAAEVRISAE